MLVRVNPQGLTSTPGPVLGPDNQFNWFMSWKRCQVPVRDNGKAFFKMSRWRWNMPAPGATGGFPVARVLNRPGLWIEVSA